VAGDRDTNLVARLRCGDPAAAEALVEAYGDRVYRQAVRITGNTRDAEEVVQDVLWAAIRKIDTFREAAAFGTWLHRITFNAAYQKRRGRRSTRNMVPWDDFARSFDEQGRHVEPVVDRSAWVADPIIQIELRSVLATAIAHLPEAYRVPLLWHDGDGLSNADVAGALGIALATVRSRVHRARLHLRQRLADYIAGVSTR
jgi:RNA polymerase sigma-70 factor (ECF subfamily)